MTVMEITAVVVVKSLWWLAPSFGGLIVAAILETKGVI